MVRAGDYRVQTGIERAVERAGAALEIVPYKHFLCSLEDFDAWAEGRKQLHLQHFSGDSPLPRSPASGAG